MRRRPAIPLGIVLTLGACHRAPPTLGPDPLRTAADCEAIIGRVRADTNPRTAPRAGLLDISLPPLPPPQKARGHTAELWVPVDESGRVETTGVRISGMPDIDYGRELQRAAARAHWSRPSRDGCWVPSWGFLTWAFSP